MYLIQVTKHSTDTSTSRTREIMSSGSDAPRPEAFALDGECAGTRLGKAIGFSESLSSSTQVPERGLLLLRRPTFQPRFSHSWRTFNICTGAIKVLASYQGL